MTQLKEVTIYTDCGCFNNPGPGGYGVVLQYQQHEKRLSGGFRLATNNRMELMAVIEGLEALKMPCIVRVYSDSKYVVDAMTKKWVHRWKANSWWRNKDERAVNIDLWEKLLELCQHHEVMFAWIKGHAGHAENETCDTLAKEAAKQNNLSIDQ